MLLILIISLVLLSKPIQSFDYCDPAVCPYQGVHVGCNNDGSFGSACFGECGLVDMEPYKKLILHEHNYYRNLLASGNLTGFQPAARMPALTWHEGLAHNAAFNVKSCIFAHDKCRSTEEYYYAGQNIYYARKKNLKTPNEDFIVEAVRLWFGEYVDANPNLMESYYKTTKPTGHFTLLVNDRNTKVGCSAMRCLQPPRPPSRLNKLMFLFTCDYPSTSIHHYPCYLAGTPGSLCEELHPKFHALCANQNIDPNNIEWYNSLYQKRQ